MKLFSVKIALAGALLGVLLSGCVVTARPVGAEVVAYEAPPAPQYEVIGVAPTPGYFWIGGAWFWEGGRYAWHPGHWQAPRPGYHWAPHAWVHVNGGWQMRPGHWVRG